MSERKSKGVIYILTNPSFKEYVKIGYASNIENRLQQLNRSETIPYAFRVYAIYEVDSHLTDKELHKLIDSLNPELRTIETFDGKKRKKEFYAMLPEEAYSLLESIAKISGTFRRLKKMKPEGHEILDEKVAEEVKEESERRRPWSFSQYGIPIGSVLVSYEQPDKTVRVVDEKHVEYHGETLSMSAATSKILGEDIWQGPRHFTYNGKRLINIRKEIENNNPEDSKG